MKTKIIGLLQELKSKSGMSYESLHESTGFSASTIQRWLVGNGAPDIYDLTTIVEAMGGTMKDIFAAVGAQEMTVTQTIQYQGAVAMQEHYETRLSSAQEKLDMLQAHHEQAIKSQQDAYDRSLQYLQTQVGEMKVERAALQERVALLSKRVEDLDRRRHNVFWGMLTALCLGSICFVFFLVIFFVR